MMVHRYYTVDMPVDFTDGMSDDDIFDVAVEEIRNRQRVYRIPAQWKLVWIRKIQDVYRYTVVRVRYSFRKEDKHEKVEITAGR